MLGNRFARYGRTRGSRQVTRLLAMGAAACALLCASAGPLWSAPPGTGQPKGGAVRSTGTVPVLSEIEVDYVLARARGDFARARDLSEKLIASHGVIYGSDDWRLSSYRHALESLKTVASMSDTDQRLIRHAIAMDIRAMASIERGEIENANRLAQQSCRLCEVLMGERNALYLAPLEQFAYLQSFYMETYSKGLKSYQRLVNILNTRYNTDAPELAFALQGLGATYTLMGEYELADSSLNAAAPNIRRHCGERSLEYAKCLYHLAQLDLERHNFGRARERLEESLVTITRKDPSDYPNIAAVRFGIARTYLGEKDFFRAKVLLCAILPDYDKLSACYPTRAQMLDAYATTLRQLNQTTEAKQIEAKAKEIRSLAQSMRGLSPGNSEPPPPAKESAARRPGKLARGEAEMEKRFFQLFEEGEFEQARGALKSWIDILAARLGPEHWQVVSAKRDLESIEQTCRLDATDRSLIHMAIGRSGEAATVAETCTGLEELPARESCRLTQLFLGENNSFYLNALAVVGWAEVNRGDAEAALETFQQVNSRQKTRFGDQHHVFASSLHGMGVCHMKLGDYDKAESSIRASMAIVGRDLGESSVDFAALLHSLGRVALARREFEPAAALFDRALAIYTPQRGKSHPICLRVQLDIARVLVEKRDVTGAHATLRDALPRFDKLPDCPLRADMLELYAATLRELKRPTDAEPLEKQAAEMRVRVAELNGSTRK